MGTIIIATDFSSIALNAVNYGISFAKEYALKIVLFHAYQAPLSFSEIPITDVGIEELSILSKERLDELKKDLAHIHGDTLHIQCESVMGELVFALNGFCEKVKPICVIIGSRGESMLENIFLGSNSHELIRKLEFGLLIVPPGGTFKGITQFTLACDMTDVVMTIPDQMIKTFLRLTEARINIVTIYKDDMTEPEKVEQSLLLQTMLQEYDPVFKTLVSKDISRAIHQYAEESNTDLLIVIPKIHRGLAAIFEKKHVDDFVYHTHIPILSLPAENKN